MKRAALTLLLLALSCATPPPAPEVVPEQPETPATREERVIATVRVTASSLNVRKEPSTSGDVVTQVRRGTQLSVLSEEKGWSKVRTAAGEIGWVASQHVSRVEPKRATQRRRRGACPPDSSYAFVRAPMPAFSEGGPHGLVVVDATVNTSGDVTSTKVISNSTGEPALAQIAEREIRSSKFIAPVKDCVTRTFIFTYKRSF